MSKESLKNSILKCQTLIWVKADDILKEGNTKYVSGNQYGITKT